jgi:hypothetical protein
VLLSFRDRVLRTLEAQKREVEQSRFVLREQLQYLQALQRERAEQRELNNSAGGSISPSATRLSEGQEIASKSALPPHPPVRPIGAIAACFVEFSGKLLPGNFQLLVEGTRARHHNLAEGSKAHALIDFPVGANETRIQLAHYSPSSSPASGGPSSRNCVVLYRIEETEKGRTVSAVARSAFPGGEEGNNEFLLVVDFPSKLLLIQDDRGNDVSRDGVWSTGGKSAPHQQLVLGVTLLHSGSSVEILL